MKNKKENIKLMLCSNKSCGHEWYEYNYPNRFCSWCGSKGSILAVEVVDVAGFYDDMIANMERKNGKTI